MPASGDSRPVVGHLVQMGTPNMGSPCADTMLQASLVTQHYNVFPEPATAQLTTFAMTGFNHAVTQLKGVALSNLVGTGYALPCGDDSGDLIVPDWSATKRSFALRGT